MQPGWITKQCHCWFLFPHKNIKEMHNRLRAHQQQKRIQNKISKAEIVLKNKRNKTTNQNSNCTGLTSHAPQIEPHSSSIYRNENLTKSLIYLCVGEGLVG